MSKLRTLDLFSGIGGFSLGLERTGGFETVAFCEVDPFCRRVLAKHWPNVRQYEDVRELTSDVLERDGIGVDVICGGFPCQDISLAGGGAGLDGERSGLWSEFARLIGELRPEHVIVENVSALLSRGLGTVLGDLAALGYDAEWHCIPAAAVGAPHRRDRIWILAHPQHDRLSVGRRAENAGVKGQRPHGISGDDRPRGVQQAQPALADAAGERCRETRGLRRNQSPQRPSGSGSDVSDANKLNGQGVVDRRNDAILRREQIERQARLCSGAGEHQDWSAEPAVGRVAHGVPDRVGQLRAYGNAVVPQIPELIGHAILEARSTELEAA